MKGIIIYSNPMRGDNERATYCEFMNEASFDLKTISKDQIGQCGHYIWKVGERKKIVSRLEGEASEKSKAVCSKNDTYDFETGALIALMKMCGLEKSAKAYAEIFDDTAYGDALIERDKLKEKVDDLYTFNKKLIDEIDQKNHEIISLKALKVSNEALKKDNESFRKTCEKLKEENERLNTSICAKEVLNAKLLKDYNAAQSAYEIMVEKSADLMDEVKKLEGENEKLKFDCEKLQHGYVDTDNVPSGHWDGDILDIVFLPGRACGKQYKTLVELFKKIDQKKVDAAYKEAYNTTLPVWQKEFLNRMYGIYKESREKAELPRTLDINGTVYRKSIQIKDFGEEITKLAEESSTKPAFTIDGFMIKNKVKNSNLLSLTKREKMWDYILKEGRTPVYVERKDVHDFLEECQIAGIKWQSGKMPLETIPFNMSEGNDGMYFFVMTSRTPNGFRHVMTWWVTAYDEDSKKTINYLPPMRWDLFKKGRKIIRVTPENFGEAMAHIRANVNLATAYKGWESVIKNSFNKSHAFIRISAILKGTDRGIIEFMWPEDLVKKQLADPTVYSSNKIVDWEDVR